jgi:lipopolysaccharide/colanic/teichoic acid biosynthesis glycosyltransferase
MAPAMADSVPSDDTLSFAGATPAATTIPWFPLPAYPSAERADRIEVGLSSGARTTTRRSRAAKRSQSLAIYHAAKRVVDVTLSLFGLIVLAPLFLLIAILVRLDSPGPIVHRRRVLARQDYKYGTPPSSFDAFKFRTMVPNAEELLRRDPQLRREYEKEFKLRQDPRITRLGARLRAWSLDELPQLVNVLRGEMTLVGPRMISPPELAMYGEHGGDLLSVKPGLTGLWQVSGRQHIAYRERVRLDMWYIRHRSIGFDLSIVWRTIGCVLARTGAF